MSRLCPGKEAEVASDDFIVLSDVTETAVSVTSDTRCSGSGIVQALPGPGAAFRLRPA